MHSLFEAVARGDIADARAWLESLLATSKEAERVKFYPHKAKRADGFRVEGDAVRFSIERHPGLSFTTHTVQEWSVDGEGNLTLEEERRDRWTLETAAEWLRNRPAEERSPRDAVSFSAAAAVEYANAWMHEEGDASNWNRDAALAWVLLVAGDSSRKGRWPGRIEHVEHALFSDGSPSDDARDTGREVNALARVMWSEVRKMLRRPGRSDCT